MITAAWIIFAIGVVWLLLLMLSKVPVISDRVVGRSRVLVLTDSLFGYIKRKIKIFFERVFHFILEAKDLKPPLPINRIAHTAAHSMEAAKKAFRIRIRASEAEPVWMPEAAALNAESAAEHADIEQRYLESIKRNPNDIASFEGLGRLYLQEKNYPEATETFEYLTKLNPKRDVYWSNLGLSLFSIKRYKEASIAYQKALDLNDKIPVRWINLALCLDSLDEPMKSIKAVTQALQLAPRNINYQFLLADLYMKMDNKVRAEEVLEHILQIEPTNKPAREKLMKLRI